MKDMHIKEKKIALLLGFGGKRTAELPELSSGNNFQEREMEVHFFTTFLLNKII